MINIPFFQNEWLDIKFTDLTVKTSSFKLPDSDFYSRLFVEFDKKYSSVKDLPTSWVEEKQIISDYFIKQKKGKNILSYGSGLGVVEIKINNEGGNITCSDFTKFISRFIKENNLNFVDVNEIKKKYDIIFFSYVLYSLNKKELKELIKRLKINLNSEGEFIVIFHEKKKVQMRDILRILYLIIFKKHQFWGYERDSEFYRRIFFSEGFKQKSIELLSNHTILTFGS